MIKNLKKYLSVNFLALSGWLNLIIYLWMLSIEIHARQFSDGTDSGTWLFWGLCLFLSAGLVCIAIIIGIVEYVAKYKIKNIFILENKLYNLVFWAGLLIAIPCSLASASILLYSLVSVIK